VIEALERENRHRGEARLAHRIGPLEAHRGRARRRLVRRLGGDGVGGGRGAARALPSNPEPTATATGVSRSSSSSFRTRGACPPGRRLGMFAISHAARRDGWVGR
jgi:hypothetical protein